MRRHGGRFLCPLCREYADEAPSMASELQWADGSGAGSAVKGPWGTKVTAIVEEVAKLPPGDKCLIFSRIATRPRARARSVCPAAQRGPVRLAAAMQSGTTCFR